MSTMLDVLSASAVKKAERMHAGLGRYIISSMLAGIYIGFAMFLIFTIGGLLAVSGVAHFRILMGVCFGIGLSLVIMLETELFTGNVMITGAGVLDKAITVKAALWICVWSYIGNFMGSMLIGVVFYWADTVDGGVKQFFVDVCNSKVSVSNSVLFFRGVLCNMLVCMAVLSCLRLKEETAKLIMIFWCLFAFITTGFEHCIANMSIFTAALLLGAGQVQLGPVLNNILWVTLGNMVGGASLGIAYFIINRRGS